MQDLSLVLRSTNQTDESLRVGFRGVPLFAGGASDLRRMHVDVGRNDVTDRGIQCALPRADALTTYSLGLQGLELTSITAHRIGQCIAHHLPAVHTVSLSMGHGRSVDVAALLQAPWPKVRTLSLDMRDRRLTDEDAQRVSQ